MGRKPDLRGTTFLLEERDVAQVLLVTIDGTRDQVAERFVGGCVESLVAVYSSLAGSGEPDRARAYAESVRCVAGMLAILVAAERMPRENAVHEAIRRAGDALARAADGSLQASIDYESACHRARELSGIGILSPRTIIAPDVLAGAARELLRPRADVAIDSLFFETMPLHWLGSAYQGMLAFVPEEEGDGLKKSHSARKGAGVYFTPPYLVDYIVRSVLESRVDELLGEVDDSDPAERVTAIRVVDPAAGGGDFLCRAVDYLCERTSATDARRANIAACCVYGVDVDPVAVDISRFCAWCASGFADGIANALESHIVRADVLGAHHGDAFEWSRVFPEVFASESAGFDAVVGNPPYIAGKNGLMVNGTRLSSKGQSDSYLLFLKEVIGRRLVRPGGMLSMVLPDPVLVRGNAAEVRRKLAREWSIRSVLHMRGVFSDAQVANAVPVCRNCPPEGDTFLASRIESAADRRSFARRPMATVAALAVPVRRDTVLAQKRCELLYLLEQGAFGEVIRGIHGDRMALSDYQAPFIPLAKLNVRAIYRGEELGKGAISGGDGDLPMLLGGQSIHPYEITWEGRRIWRSAVRKSLKRYACTKILIQKSSGRLIAALDDVGEGHAGYVFPQSVYAVEMGKPGVHELYLLCILNSEVMNEYIWRTATGYKFIQPQIEIEDIRALPIRRIEFVASPEKREFEVMRAVEFFERESERAGSGTALVELDNFVAKCLSSEPEMSDVVHDLLVYLGGRIISLKAQDKSSPGAEVTRTLALTRAAVETIVRRLYSSELLPR